jgi:hypothetical protein
VVRNVLIAVLEWLAIWNCRALTPLSSQQHPPLAEQLREVDSSPTTAPLLALLARMAYVASSGRVGKSQDQAPARNNPKKWNNERPQTLRSSFAHFSRSDASPWNYGRR